jgi:hypothetical protein
MSQFRPDFLSKIVKGHFKVYHAFSRNQLINFTYETFDRKFRLKHFGRNSFLIDCRSVIRANVIENMWSLVYTMADLNIAFAQVKDHIKIMLRSC